MSAASRVRDHRDIMRHILELVEAPVLVYLSPLFLPDIAAILYRSCIAYVAQQIPTRTPDNVRGPYPRMIDGPRLTPATPAPVSVIDPSPESFQSNGFWYPL